MIRILLLSIVCLLTLSSCNALKPKKVDTRETPIKAEDRARKNINEGRGTSLKDLIGGGSTNYEFSTSNPMWRASLEILDFLPLTTVDYSGGIIITDWYSEESSDDSIKITVRFLDNQVRADSLKIIVHKKNCSTDENCKINLLNKSTIKSELLNAIIKKAADIEIASKNKKK